MTRTLKPLPPIRVRREPPTIEEALVAAQGLTDDPQQQVEIAAGLMGVSEEEVRPCVARVSRMVRASRDGPRAAGSIRSQQNVVVVERRTRFRSRRVE